VSYLTPILTLDPDECVDLSGTPTFMVAQGLDGGEFELQIKDGSGRPIELLPAASEPASQPASEPADAKSVVLRFREASLAYTGVDIYESENGVELAAEGKIHFTLPQAIIHQPGIYLGEAAVSQGGKKTAIQQMILSVERSLFGNSTYTVSATDGPPTLREVWLNLQDSSVRNIWTGGVEFAAEDIVEAILAPIREYNESPPNVGVYTTRDFPWRYYWMQGVIGYLCERAAHNYRRTKRQLSGGGMAEDTRNKDRDYQDAADRKLKEWRDFMRMQKLRHSRDEMWGGMAGNGIGRPGWGWGWGFNG
jgi:hypothetical protein